MLIQISIDEGTPAFVLRAIATLAHALLQEQTPRLAPADHPSAGSPVSPIPHISERAAVPFPLPVPSSVVALVPPTAPVATMGFSAVPAPVAILPVPQFAPPAAAPAVAPTPNPAPPAGVDVDSEGLPWDVRIHAGGAKGKNQDGTWRSKRGVDEAQVTKVKGELRQLMSLPPPAVPMAPPVPAPVIPTIPLVPASQMVPAVPMTPADYAAIPPALPPGGAPIVTTFNPPSLAMLFADVPPPPVAHKLGPTPTGYEDFLSRVTALTSAGTLQVTTLIAAGQAVGLPSLAGVASRPDLIPALWEKLA